MTERKEKHKSGRVIAHLVTNILVTLAIIALIVTMSIGTWGCLVLIIAVVTGIILLILLISWSSNISNLMKWSISRED